MTDRDLGKASAAAAAITASGGKLLALQVDVSRKASVEAMVAATLQAHGWIAVLIAKAARFSVLVKRPFDRIPKVGLQSIPRTIAPSDLVLLAMFPSTPGLPSSPGRRWPLMKAIPIVFDPLSGTGWRAAS